MIGIEEGLKVIVGTRLLACTSVTKKRISNSGHHQYHYKSPNTFSGHRISPTLKTFFTLKVEFRAIIKAETIIYIFDLCN
jgi:hypothetical protein